VQITIVTFKGYNEQDQLVAAGILNRMRRQARRAFVKTSSFVSEPGSLVRVDDGII